VAFVRAYRLTFSTISGYFVGPFTKRISAHQSSRLLWPEPLNSRKRAARPG
jgi:hypothetical protein